MRRLIEVLFLVFCTSVNRVWCFSGVDVNNVITKLMTTDGYNKNIRPLVDQTLALNITVDFYLKSIVGFDEKDESLKTAGYLFCTWVDEYLQWNSSAYNGVNFLYLPQDDVWKPDLALGNAFKTFTGLGSTYLNIRVDSNGNVEWYPFQILESTCSLDITYFPFDIQECEMKFTAWSYSISEVDISIGVSGVLLNDYIENAAWALHSTSYKDVNNAESAVIFLIRLRRKPLFYMMNVFVPVILLSILNLFTFCLPHSSGERASYAITVFLSLAVFLTIVASTLPQNSDKVSLMSVYLSIMSAISTFIVAISIVEIRLSSRTEKHKMNKLFTAFMKFYNFLRCRSCMKNTVVDALPQKEKGDSDSCSRDLPVETVYTWNELVNAVDFILFCICLFCTGLCTVILFTICGLYKLDTSSDKNAVSFDYY